jgi:hypothetical protein
MDRLVRRRSGTLLSHYAADRLLQFEAGGEAPHGLMKGVRGTYHWKKSAEPWPM